MEETLRREILYKSRYPSEWERLFEFWSRPPSDSEQERCQRTVNEITAAIRDHAPLSGRGLKTFPQGSYANRVNIRKESDVDICVLTGNTVQFKLAAGMEKEDTGLTFPASYSYEQYKDDIEDALVNRFGRQNVTRGNKAFDVHNSGYNVDADVVATFEFRKYYLAGGAWKFHRGTALFTENEGSLVTNFPEQQKQNGIEKNDATRRRFRQQVRIIKTIRYNMSNWGEKAADSVSSFGLESIFWGIDDSGYLIEESHFLRVCRIMELSYNKLRTHPEGILEVNGIKKLFSEENGSTSDDYIKFFRDAYAILVATP